MPANSEPTYPTEIIRVPLWSHARHAGTLGGIVCEGECIRIPWGLTAEKIAGTDKRPLVRVYHAGRFWYGWIWSDR